MKIRVISDLHIDVNAKYPLELKLKVVKLKRLISKVWL